MLNHLEMYKLLLLDLFIHGNIAATDLNARHLEVLMQQDLVGVVVPRSGASAPARFDGFELTREGLKFLATALESSSWADLSVFAGPTGDISLSVARKFLSDRALAKSASY